MSVSPAFKAQIENHLNELATKDELFAVTKKKKQIQTISRIKLNK